MVLLWHRDKRLTGFFYGRHLMKKISWSVL